MKLQTDVKDTTNIKLALERKVGELQPKAERLTQLELEKKKFLDKEKKFDEASQSIKVKLEESEKKLRDLEDENIKLRKQASTVDPNAKPDLRSRVTNATKTGRKLRKKLMLT